MGDACRLLSKVYGVVGGIGTFVVSYVGGRTAELGYLSVEYERNWFLTIAIFIGAALSVVMICVALFTLGEV